MQNINYTFNMSARWQLIEFTEALIKAIPHNVFFENAAPFIISVNGTPNSGKSLIWDVITNIFCQNEDRLPDLRPLRAASSGRAEEHYEGKIPETKQPLKVLCINAELIDSKFNPRTKPTEQLLYKLKQTALDTPENEESLRDICDLLIANNIHMPSAGISLNIEMGKKISTADWYRQLHIDQVTPALLETETFPAFLETHCEAI